MSQNLNTNTAAKTPNQETQNLSPADLLSGTTNEHSIVTKVLQDIAAGTLRFALFGTSDGGVEIWRASVLELPPKPIVQEMEPLVCNAATARKLLGGISVSSLWKLEQRGIVKQLPNFPKAHYSIEHLKKVIATNENTQKTTKWKKAQ